MLVDTRSLLLKVIVTEASRGERDGAAWLLLAVVGLFQRLQIVWANGGYAGGDCVAGVLCHGGLRLEISERDPSMNGFQLLPRRWVIERTFAWFGNARRLSKDYEYHLQSREAMIDATTIRSMLRRLATLETTP